MKFVALLLLVTVLDLLLICQALDDDEEEDRRKYSVTFFQFNPKDLGILRGHRKGPAKRQIKRSAVEPPSKPVNITVAPSVKSSNESSVQTNSTSAVVKQVSNNTSISVNETKPVITRSDVTNTSKIHTKDNNTYADPSDVNIMNALIDLAVQKNYTTSENKTADTRSNTNVTSPVNVTSEQKNAPLSNTTSAVNKTTATGAAMAKRTRVTPKRNGVLNPNPKPSEQEAMLNVKPPKQLEDKEHDPLIHDDNTTDTLVTKDKHETITNDVQMVKNKNPEPAADKGSEQNVTETEKEAAQKKKLAKDKQTNKEIKEGAKDIKPVANTVGNIMAEVHDIMKDSGDAKKEGDSKNAHARTSVQDKKEVDDKTIKHRTSVAEFVPLYHKTTVKDHKLSFQVGSMKHPKHNIHPKCHACPLNSTYKECVKKSTLRQCSEGLNNICFTKSTKKNGIITYEMGCADHNNCVRAKAFPCKDGKEHCFTCCQFDRCNSSPHHGDYELDEISLDELSDPVASASYKDTTTLDSKSATEAISGTWIAYASTLFVLLILRL